MKPLALAIGTENTPVPTPPPGIADLANKVSPYLIPNSMRYALWRQLRLPHIGPRQMLRGARKWGNACAS